jgi:hypothetical protein
MNGLRTTVTIGLAALTLGLAAPPASPATNRAACDELARQARVAKGVGMLFDTLGNYDYASNYWDRAFEYLSRARACYERR